MIKNYTKTPLSRRVFFWTLAVSCISIISLVIFFSCGYRFNFTTNIFIHAGSINVKSTPSNISAIIYDKKPRNRHFNLINNSYHITGIHHGFHDVTFSAKNYKDWKKRIRIHSGFATEFWNVILVKNNYEYTKYNVTNPKHIFFAPKYELMTYIVKSNTNKLLAPIINTDKNISESIIKDSNSVFDTSSNENIEWSPDTFTLLIPILRTSKTINVKTSSKANDNSKNTLESKLIEQKNISITKKTINFIEPKKDYLITNRMDNLEVMSIYLSSLLPRSFFLNESLTKSNEKFNKKKLSSDLNTISKTELNDKTIIKETYPIITSLRFHPKRHSTIYGIINNDLYSIDISKLYNAEQGDYNRTTKLMSDILAYDITDDGIYVLSTRGSLFYDKDYDLSNPKTLTGFPHIQKDTKHTLIAYDKNRVLHLSEKDGLLTIFNKYEKNTITKPIRNKIKNARFSNDGKKIIYHDTNSIYLYMTRDWKPLFRERDTEYKITTVDSAINRLEWLDDYEHVIVGIDKKILLIDLDHRFTPLKTEILSNSANNNNIVYNYKNNKLYFINSLKNDTKQLFSIYFPEEKKGLFQ